MNEKKELTILWTNTDITTAQLMVMTYSRTCMLARLWDKITVVMWGTTVRLMAENENLQEYYRMAAHAGVKFSACLTCAQQFRVIDKLTALGVEVIPWVDPFTVLLQENHKILTV
jgi:hypothetical protein